jgi:hypothetical protein
MTLLLSNEDVARALTYEDALQATEAILGSATASSRRRAVG